MKAKKQAGRLIRVDVVYHRADRGWAIRRDGATAAVMLGSQREALRQARELAKKIGADAAAGNIAGARGASLRWQRKRDRRWVNEATYPRSADPRRSRG